MKMPPNTAYLAGRGVEIAPGSMLVVPGGTRDLAGGR